MSELPYTSPRVQRVVELLYDQIVQSGAFATDLVAAHFRRDRQLGSKDRNAASTVFYEILRFQRLLSFALESGTGSKGHRSPGGRELYLAWLVINEHLPPAEAAALVPHVDWYQVRGYQGHLASVMDPVARLGITQSVPDWLAAVFLEEYPGEAEELLSALNRRAPLTLRTNTLRTDAQQLAMRLAKEGCETVPCELAQNGLRLKRNTNVFSLSAFKDGWFEVQDEASQLIADLVAPPPGGTIADVCAGAGGKTLALSALLGNRGRIVAADPHQGRLDELVRRAKRAGCSNIQVARILRNEYPAPLLKHAGEFSRVLADVPCSGLGALRRNPETRWRLTEEELGRLPVQQRAIASKAISLLAPGGRLIYSTCTILRRENEAVVEGLQSLDPRLELVSPAEIWGKDRSSSCLDPSGRFLKLLPHRHGTDGFFAAVLRLPRTGRMQ